MKNSKIVLAILSIASILACNKVTVIKSPTAEPIWTKGGLTFDAKELDTANFVSLEDVQAYAHYHILLAKNNGIELSVERIDPLGPNAEITLCYLINYNDGWEVISADKRTPIVLAGQEKGSLILEECNENEAFALQLSWVGHLAKDVLAIRSDPDYSPDSREAQDAIESSRLFWKVLTHPEEVLGDHPRGLDDGAPGTRGYWQLIDTEVRYTEYDNVTLTTTTWNQESPYNDLAPVLYDSESIHAKAGSVAIAGAQMLYYLHSYYGYNASIPSYALATGDIFDYSIDFDYFSPNNWVNIDNGNTSMISNLVAYVGDLLPNDWRQDITLASFSDLKTNVFNYLGISCTLANYSAQTALSSLQSHCPVVIHAEDYVYFLGIIIDSYKHAFLMDRYKRYMQIVSNTYRWIYQGNEMIDFMDEYVEDIVTGPMIYETVGMNWGWNPTSVNDTWYTISGSWDISQYTYDDNRKMIYGFSM